MKNIYIRCCWTYQSFFEILNIKIFPGILANIANITTSTFQFCWPYFDIEIEKKGHILQISENALILLLLPEISFEMHLTVNADKNSRQQEQRSTMVQLVDCKDELNMAMLKVIFFFFRKKSFKNFRLFQKLC